MPDHRMKSTAIYIVRKGFTFTDVAGAHPRTYRAGESVPLPPDIGDAAHQLHRAPAAAAPGRTTRKSAAQGGNDGDE